MCTKQETFFWLHMKLFLVLVKRKATRFPQIKMKATWLVPLSRTTDKRVVVNSVQGRRGGKQKDWPGKESSVDACGLAFEMHTCLARDQLSP